jgi:hypothetical protein
MTNTLDFDFFNFLFLYVEVVRWNVHINEFSRLTK